jgi:hypothetical protein
MTVGELSPNEADGCYRAVVCRLLPYAALACIASFLFV